jgi:HPt (histidine-containing phosphotransfer) domain-containing protein
VRLHTAFGNISERFIMADIVLINIEEGSKRVMNNTKLYAKLLIKFKDDPNMQNIENAFNEGEKEKAQTAVHALKGLASNLSLIELTAKAIELEAQIKTGLLNQDMLSIVKEIYKLTIIEADKVITKYA